MSAKSFVSVEWQKQHRADFNGSLFGSSNGDHKKAKRVRCFIFLFLRLGALRDFVWVERKLGVLTRKAWGLGRTGHQMHRSADLDLSYIKATVPFYPISRPWLLVS